MGWLEVSPPQEQLEVKVELKEVLMAQKPICEESFSNAISICPVAVGADALQIAPQRNVTEGRGVSCPPIAKLAQKSQ